MIKSSFWVATFLMLLLVFTVEARSHVDVVFSLRKYGAIVSSDNITEVRFQYS